MYKLFSIFSISSLLQGHTLNRRALSTIGTTLMLSALLSACGGGSSDAPSPTTAAPTTPTFTVSSGNLSVDEDFASPRLVASVANATAITFSQSNTGVVTVTNSNAQVNISRIANATGRTVLTIRATNGTLMATTQVTVIVNAVNDPPTLAVSSNSISTVGGFSPITINTTASDIEDTNLTFTVSESTTGVVRVTQSANAINLSSIPNASGQTTLIVRAVDSSGSLVTQTIAVNVAITTSTSFPALSVSSALVNEQEDFGSVVIRTTATDSDGDTITLSVSASIPIVTAVISTPVNGQSTVTNKITLSSAANANGTATLTVRATDAGGQSTEVNIVVVVAAVNDAPTFTIPTPNVVLGEDFASTRIATVTDVENNTLTISVAESSTGVVTVTTSASSVQISSIANINGQTTLTITISDGNLSSTAQVVVTVTAVNDAPTLTIPTPVVVVGEEFANAVVIATATDLENNTLTISVAESTTGVVTVTTSASNVSVSSILNANGQTTLTITVNDGTSDTTAQVVVTVTAVNDPPTLSVSTNALTLAEEFGSFLIATTRTDIDGDTLTLTVAESTTGLVTVTTTASGVQVASILNANGQTTLTISLSDGGLSTATQVVINVTPVNDAPSLNIPTTNVVVDEDFATAVVIATATDVENNTLTISVAESTTGVVTVTTSASNVSVSSILNVNGQTTLTITVNDGTSDTTAQVVVTVTSVNDTPTLTVSNNNITAVVNFSTITINTTASDVDEGALSFSVQVTTAGVVTVTTSTNAIFLNAVAGSTGQTSIVVRTVDSGGLSAMQTIAVNVLDNSTPTLTVSTNLINVQEDFGTEVVIRTTATDSIGASIALSVSPSSLVVVVVSTPVSGMSTITNTITLTAINNASGRSTLTVQATSAGGQTTSTEIVVVITSVNDTPTLTIPNANLVVAEDFSVNSTIATASDIDGDTPIFSVVESMTGLVTVSTSAAGVFVSSILHANGQTTLTITVSDGLLSSTAQVVVTVTEINDPPVLNIPNATVTRLENFLGGVTVATASDVDGNPLTFSVVESTPGVIRVTVTTSDVRISSLGDVNGVTTLSISVSDGNIVSSTAQVVVNVTPVNDPPRLTVSTTALTLAEEFTAVLIATTRTDIDSNTLTLTVAESATGVVTVTVTDAGVSVSSIAQMSGRTTLTITLSDNDLTSTAQVVVDVIAVNDPPVLTVSTNALTLNEDFGSVMIATTRSDVEGDTLTLTVAESTTGVVTVQTTSSGVSVSSIAHKNGRTTLTITLSDSQLSSTAQVVVDVTPINDAPTFSIPSATLTVEEDFASTLTIATANDVDGDTLTITVVESSTGIVSVTTSASIVQIVSLRDVNGQTTLTLTVSDSSLSLTTQVVVTVTAVNDPPVLSVTTPVFLINEDFSTFTILVNRSDVDSNTLTLTVAESATGVVTVTPTTLGFEVSSISGANGRTTLTITLSDGDQSTTTQVVVDVGPVNDPPVLTVSTTALTLAEDFATVLIATTRTDIDSTTLTLTVAESTTGVVTATVTDTGVQVVNIPNANGQTTLTITLSDGRLSTTTQVVVEVTAINDPPSLTVTTTALTLAEDFAEVMIGTTRMDIDSTTLTLTVAESATGVVTVQTTTSGVSVSSIENINGRTTLTITLSDSLLTSIAQVVIDVTAVNDPPVLTVTTNALTLAEDFAEVMIGTTRMDIDSTTLTLTVAESATGVVTVTVTTTDVSVSSIAHKNGRTTLTISLSDGRLSTTTEVVVEVTAVNDPPSLSVTNTSLTLNEDFNTTQLITVNRSDIENDTLTFSVAQSMPVIVSVSTTSAGVQVVGIGNANGQTTLTITVSDGQASASTQVVVTVNAVNDTPTLTVSTNSITTFGGFSPITINTTASDIEDGTLAFTVSASPTGVVTVSQSANAITLNAISGGSGQTTLTVRTVDTSGTVVTQTIAVNVPNRAPFFIVSTSLISVQEDFMTSILLGSAVDLDGNTVTISVSSNTHLVDVAISTQVNSIPTINLSAIENANGTTTLTIQAMDTAGLSVSTEVVVVVAPVNDPPALTVSLNVVTVGSGPVVLTVSASDVEDSTLSFSVSTGQGIVNTAITTTSLTITRIGMSTSSVMLTLRTTDTDNASTFTIVTVLPEPRLIVTTGIKTLDFAWSTITSATHYQLLSVPVSGSGNLDLSTTGVVVSPNSTNIRQSTAQALVALHRYIPNVTNPQYLVGTCHTTSSCGASFRHNSVSLTNAQLNSMIGRLQANNTGSGDEFGWSVSLSGDGNTLAVGAFGEGSSSTGVNGAQNDSADDSGAVYLFRRIGGAWSQQAYIKASNTGSGDQFGWSVSLNGDGNTLAVGAIYEDSSSTGVNGAQNDNSIRDTGTVYLFRFNTGSNNWSQQAYIKASLSADRDDEFGRSLSLSADGNTLAVGTNREDGSSTGVNGLQNNNSTNTGAVYLFRFNTTSNTWFQQAYIKASNTGATDLFGQSLSLNGDGNTLAVGATGEDGSSAGVNGVQNDNSTNTGAVYLFRFNSSTWSQQAYIKASNTGSGDQFGWSVSLSGDGNTLAVGANREASSSTGVNGAQGDNSPEGPGAVYLFRFNLTSNTWSQQAYIKASNTDRFDNFGQSVSLSADGNTLAVGADTEDGSATGVSGADDNGTQDAGATYVFEFANGAWAQQAYIKSPDPTSLAYFGYSVSLSSNGNSLAVGAYRASNETGAVYLY